jgi:hypothetical protein
MAIIKVLLAVSALYCAGMWVFLAIYAARMRTNLETETFHLGLCFILSIGFLGLLLAQGG